MMCTAALGLRVDKAMQVKSGANQQVHVWRRAGDPAARGF